jgi:O-antigen/teichoic acid export membrane protein
MATNSDNNVNLSRIFKFSLSRQFISRSIPFVFNSWIVRHLTERDYALYAIQFHLFVTCVLFLSREGFRRACLRAGTKRDGPESEENVTRILKVAWVTVPLGIAITIAACIFVLWWQNLSYSDPYAQAIWIHGILWSFLCLYHSSLAYSLGIWKFRFSVILVSVINSRTNLLTWQDLHVYWSLWLNLCISSLRHCWNYSCDSLLRP